MENRTDSKKINLGFILRLFIPFAFGFFISALYRSVLNVLAPQLVTEFSLTAADLGLMGSTYFIVFAVAQYPLGVCLDRFGARRTLSFMILFAALGAFLFSQATTMNHLMIGRGLVGLGVAGALMAALKSYSEWLPIGKLPLINSCQACAGGIGAMVATKPVQLALAFTDWRGVFLFLTGLTVLCSLLIYFMVPKKAQEGNTAEPIGKQLLGTLKIASTAEFWQLAPAATFAQASFLAINSLWVGPWLKDVAGLPSASAATQLLFIAGGIAVGYFLNGFLADKLEVYGVKPALVCWVGMACFTLTLTFIALAGATAGLASWIMMLIFGPFSILAYAIYTETFDKNLTGRVITLYNCLVFLVSFVLQWLTGVIINLYPMVGKNFNPEGYKMAFLMIAALNAVSLVWMLAYKKGHLKYFEKRPVFNRVEMTR